ncbi:MAG: NfeD family protein [Thermoplasmata archaeon]
MSAEVTVGLDIIGWILLFSGIGLVLFESIAPGGFIIVPGVVLIVLGCFGIAWPEMFTTIWAPVIVLCTAIPTTIIVLYVYRMAGKPEAPTTTVATSLIGKTGIVTAEVIPHTLRGKVKIEHDIWSATAAHPIPVGTKVKVIKAEGVHVEVEALAEKEGRTK